MAEDIYRLKYEKYNRYIVLAAIVASIAITLFVNVYLGIDVAYTHFYYIPIILTGIWYYRKAIYLAFFLGASHVLIGYWLAGELIPSTIVRAAMFIAVAIVVAYLSESRDRLYQKVRSSEQNLNVIFNSVYDAIFIHDERGRIKDVNRRMLEMYGVSREEALRLDIADLSGPQAPVGELTAIWKSVMAGEERLFEWTARRPADDSTFPAEVYLKKISLSGEGYIMATVRDISARKRAEEERLKLAKDIRLLLESTDEGIVGVDMDGRCTFINRSAQRILGYAADEVLGKNLHQLVHYKKRDGAPCPKEDCCVYQSVESGEGCRVSDDVFWRKDGTWFPVEYSSYPIVENGVVKGSVVTFTDITSRVRTEEEVREARKRAELYVDLMGHDINNMNQIGIGYLEEALATLGLKEEDKPLLTKPLEALYNSSRLIENVRKLQALSEGKLSLKPVDVGRALADVLSQYPRVPGQEVVVNVRALEGCTVMANDLLRDVFSNIIGNAIKHSEGQVTVDIAFDRIERDGRKYCRVTIQDTGPGIPDDLKGKLFTRFQRGTTKASGKGLGLYLVRSLVESYHGQVRVEDRVPGDYTKGARFVVELPAIQ